MRLDTTVASAAPGRSRSFRVALWSLGSICLGMLILWGIRTYRYHSAIRHVEELGGRVTYDYEFDGNGGYASADPNALRGWLRNQVGDAWFGNVVWVELHGTQATDADLYPLAQFTELHLLDLLGTKVTGTGFRDLSHLDRLKYLDLSGTPTTAEGLDQVSRIRSIRHLNLWGVDETQDRVTALLQFEKLELIEWDIDWGERRVFAAQLEEAFPGITVYSP